MTVPNAMNRGTNAADLDLVRLLHLVSPSLPTGAFSYSQGMEWAVEAGWLTNAEDVRDWLGDQLQGSLMFLDLPVLVRLYRAAAEADDGAFTDWIDRLLAGRETAELQAEEGHRGRALLELLSVWGMADALKDPWSTQLARSQVAGFAFAARAWGIEERTMLLGYTWAWLENLVLAAIKLVPLGQRQGQRILIDLTPELQHQVDQALRLEDDDIGASTPALAIASSLHERQYTRLYRS